MSNAWRSVIVCRDVHKWYGSFHALKGVSLTVSVGEVVVVVGPSGSGKSTFVRVLNRMERHERGDVLVNGVRLTDDLRDIDSVRRGVGMVFQTFNLFSHMSVLGNVSLAPHKVLKMERCEAEARALEVLDMVGMARFADRLPHQLSGGEQQRVAIARALAMRPSVMLFDEPTSNLDAEMIREVLDVMGDLAASQMTIIAVTHEIRFAREVADRVLMLDEGRIIEDRAPDEFFDRPRSERARLFLSRVL